MRRSGSSGPSRRTCCGCEPSTPVEELREALIDFRTAYNEHWLIERHGHRSPAQFRREQMDSQPMAA